MNAKKTSLLSGVVLGVACLAAWTGAEIRTSLVLADPNPMTEFQLRQFAWNTLNGLSEVKENPDQTEWESSWASKCNVELAACPDSKNPLFFPGTRVGRLRSKLDSEGINRFSNSFALAVQSSGHNDTEPQFAEVLFNDKAQASIKESLPKLRSVTSEGIRFKEGSIIAKVIWSLVPIQNNRSFTTRYFRPAVLRYSPDEGSTPGKPGHLNPAVGSSDYRPSSLDTTVVDIPNSGCLPPSDPNAPVPLDCLHAFPLQGNSKAVSGIQSEPGLKTAISHVCGTQCIAVLMGIHFMVRLKDDGASPNAKLSPWVFMTFWWTGEDNQTGLKAPWKYFQMNVTRSARADQAADGKRNICFNPYLEGPNRPAGAEVNCVTCHTFARYNQTNLPGESTSKISDGVGRCLGGMPISGPALSAGESCPINYYQGTSKTDMVWSFASLNDPTTRPLAK